MKWEGGGEASTGLQNKLTAFKSPSSRFIVSERRLLQLDDKMMNETRVRMNRTDLQKKLNELLLSFFLSSYPLLVFRIVSHPFFLLSCFASSVSVYAHSSEMSEGTAGETDAFRSFILKSSGPKRRHGVGCVLANAAACLYSVHLTSRLSARRNVGNLSVQ